MADFDRNVREEIADFDRSVRDFDRNVIFSLKFRDFRTSCKNND